MDQCPNNETSAWTSSSSMKHLEHGPILASLGHRAMVQQ